MHIYGAKFQEHCYTISRDIVYSVFCFFKFQTIWRHHWSNLHIRKTSISLKRKKNISKRKTPYFCNLKGLSNKQKIFFMSYALKIRAQYYDIALVIVTGFHFIICWSAEIFSLRSSFNFYDSSHNLVTWQIVHFIYQCYTKYLKKQ